MKTFRNQPKYVKFGELAAISGLVTGVAFGFGPTHDYGFDSANSLTQTTTTTTDPDAPSPRFRASADARSDDNNAAIDFGIAGSIVTVALGVEAVILYRRRPDSD